MNCQRCGKKLGTEVTDIHTCTPMKKEQARFPTELRKMWSGSEIKAWLDENVYWEKKEWVGLTDEEIEDIWGEPLDLMYSGNFEAIKNIEAKLKEKNYD